MAAADYEETEIQDLLQPPQLTGIIKQSNCLPVSVLKTPNSAKNQLSVTILDLGQSSYGSNEDQKSFLSGISASGLDLPPTVSGPEERRGSANSQREGYYGGESCFYIFPGSEFLESNPFLGFLRRIRSFGLSSFIVFKRP